MLAAIQIGGRQDTAGSDKLPSYHSEPIILA